MPTGRVIGESGRGRPPLLMLNHFRGNLDTWDPLLIDGLAREREVVLVDLSGVGGSTGIVPRNVEAMTRDAIDFVDALALTEIDVLGYSIGGMVAQELVLMRPHQVRRLVLAATGPRGGGQEMHGWIFDIRRLCLKADNGPEDLLKIFFAPTETSRQSGMKFLGRITSRTDGQDKPNAMEVARAQYDAVVEWGIPDAGKLARLAGIRQATLVANGDSDAMIPAINSHILGEHLPDARVRIYPDAGHGFLFQWAEDFAELVNEFLG